MLAESSELTVLHQREADEMGPYERLLTDAMAGDSLLFTPQDVVEAAWKIVQPVLDGSSTPYEYERGSWGPPQAERLAAEVDGWHDPSADPLQPPLQ
jgi:glucose-6-phosphate 1-dehydrogenase